MKILLHTRFYPQLGGVETVAWLLAHEWHRLGEKVTIVSDSACEGSDGREIPFPVHHRPGPLKWLSLMREADMFAHMNISLKALWPLLFVRRPFVAVNHAYYQSNDAGQRFWRDRLKLRVMEMADANIGVSQAVSKQLPGQTAIIVNPVDLSNYQTGPASAHTKDLVFLGRLVSQKGCGLLLQSLDKLRHQGLRPSLTIIGAGPERPNLDQLVTSLNLDEQVSFAGRPSSEEVARILSQHQLMVVPSIWEESFGVVALEGAACGCVVLAADGGGLPEAVGPAGLTFKKGDVDDLAAKLQWLLEDCTRLDPFRAAAPAHLARHSPEVVAAQYLEIFRKVVS